MYMLITDKERLKDFYSTERVWQLVPGIEKTKNGRLFSTFYSGIATENLGNFCVLLKSEDDGASWSEPIAVVYDGEMSRCFDPVLWIDPLGRLWFTWATGHRYGLYGVICDDPDADELVWSEEFYIGDGVMMNKPTVLSSGEWLFPVAIWDYWYTEPTFNRIKQYGDLYLDEYLTEPTGANVYKSVDLGKTIRMIGGLSTIENRSHDEHMIYEKKSGELVLLSRTKYGIARSFSYDGGKTWTVAENSGITGPESRFHIRRLKSGRLLLVNHYNFNKRSHITAMLSEDDGESWPYKLLLDERSEVSYPDATEDADGNIYITYDRERGGYKESLEETLACAREILLAKVTEADILAGEIVSDGSFVKRIISKLGEYRGERDFYTVRPPAVDPSEFVSTVMARESRDRILENLFVFYPVDFGAIGISDVKKIDELIDRVRLNENSESAFRESLLELASLLCGLPLVFDLSRGERYISELIKRINACVSGELDIKAVAYEIGISPYYLCHLFEKKIGMSVWDFRLERRFAEAKKLLATTDMKILQICAECGFSDLGFFVRKFCENERVSPEEYRNSAKRGSL